MPRTKVAPPQSCAECGRTLTRKRYNGRLEDFGVFQRRKFCDQRCMAANFDSRPVTETPHKGTAHWHSRKAIPKGPCQECGNPAGIDVHHRNWNWRDNSPENLVRLCRSCHQYAHQKRGTCRVCGEPQKGLGLCSMHYQRFKRWGDPMIVAGVRSAD